MRYTHNSSRPPTHAGVATTADFADALAGGAHIANANGPLLLVPSSTPEEITAYLKTTRSIDNIVIYGGLDRIGDGQLINLITKN